MMSSRSPARSLRYPPPCLATAGSPPSLGVPALGQRLPAPGQDLLEEKGILISEQIFVLSSLLMVLRVSLLEYWRQRYTRLARYSLFQRYVPKAFAMPQIINHLIELLFKQLTSSLKHRHRVHARVKHPEEPFAKAPCWYLLGGIGNLDLRKYQSEY